METPKSNSSKYTLSSGVHDTKGRRVTMEDTHVVLDQVNLLNSAKRVAYYGCFDGHGGTETAQMIGDILHTTVFNRQEFLEGNITNALEKAFEEADKVVVAHSLENNYMNGCTAVVGLVVDGVLHVANVGDSEAILISVENDKVAVENLTFLHKASVPSEKARIESLGGYVFFNRVFGSLAVSRAFGDSKYKQPKTAQNYVSYIPAIKTVQLNSGHRYLLLACDGLWDVCTHDEVAQIVHEQFVAGKNPKEIASFLCTEALRKRSEDNVTVIITKIDWNEECLTNNGVKKLDDVQTEEKTTTTTETIPITPNKIPITPETPETPTTPTSSETSTSPETSTTSETSSTMSESTKSETTSTTSETTSEMAIENNVYVI